MEKKDIFSINKQLKASLFTILTQKKQDFLKKIKIEYKIKNSSKISPKALKYQFDSFLNEIYSDFSSSIAKILGSHLIEQKSIEEVKLDNFTNLEQYYIKNILEKYPDKNIFIQKCLEIQNKEGKKSLSRKLHFFYEKKIKRLNLSFE